VVKQNGGIGLFGTRVKGYRRKGRTMRDKARDAHWDPLYWNARTPSLDIRKLNVKKVVVRKKGKVYRRALFTLKVANLGKVQDDLLETGSQALNFVVRWSNKTKKGTSKAKERWPIRYLAAEFDPSGSPAFYGGNAFTYELCSVSGCFPHGFLYPRPPLGGGKVYGKMKIVKGSRPDKLVFRIPFRRFGSRTRLRMDSLSAYAFASPRSAATPPTNSEAEGDRLPVLVDGVCCREVRLGR
jgi:hypothetical protein